MEMLPRNKIKKIIEQREYEIIELVLSLNNVDTDNSTIFSTGAAFKISTIDIISFFILEHTVAYTITIC